MVCKFFYQKFYIPIVRTKKVTHLCGQPYGHMDKIPNLSDTIFPDVPFNPDTAQRIFLEVGRTASEDTEVITARILSDRHGVSVDTMRKRWARNYGTGFNLDYALSEDQVATICPECNAGKKAQGASPKAEKISRSAKAQAKEIGSEPIRSQHPCSWDNGPDLPGAKAPGLVGFKIQKGWYLDAINWSEMLLSFVGFILLFQWIGIFPGLICCLYYLYTVQTMKGTADEIVKELPLYITAGISAVFCWIHGQTFWLALTIYRPDVEGRTYIANGAALILSCLSYFALVQHKLASNDSQTA